MYKRMLLVVLSVSIGSMVVVQQSYGESTTVQSSVQTVIPAKKKTAATVRTTDSIVTTTPAVARPTYDQATLKKMDDTLCVKGFDAKVGNDNKNVCWNMAMSPDLAYSCIWTQKGEGAYAPTKQGPCNLDFAEHLGNIVITKADYKSRPPVPYGTTVECCFRGASGEPTTSSTTSTSTAPLKK